MLSLSPPERSALRALCQVYERDGFPVQKQFDRISPAVQKKLLRSAFDKLSRAVPAADVSAEEATVLCMAVTYAVNTYDIAGDQAALTAVYNRLADCAGLP